MLLLKYDFPGNVREFETLSNEPSCPVRSNGFCPKIFSICKKELIVEALQIAKGNYTEAAKLLDVHPNYLHRPIKNLDAKKELDVKF